MNLQTRYLTKQLSKNFFLAAVALNGLFFLIDYALQAKTLGKESTALLSQYYVSKFSSFASLLLPFAFLIASLIVLADLNTKRQWLALQACKTSRLSLLKPFFITALLLSGLLWTNNQFFSYVSVYKPLKSKKASYLNMASDKVHARRLPGGGYLFFQNFDPEQRRLDDIYLLPDDETIWHIKTLDVDKSLGHHAVVLSKTSSGFVLTNTFGTISLDNFQLPADREELLEPGQQSLSLLYAKAALLPKSDQEAKATSYFLYKLLTPLLPLLLLFASAPTALRFSKSFSYFSLFGFWISFYIIVMALLDAAFFLGESYLLNPALAICLPLLLVLSVGVYAWNRST